MSEEDLISLLENSTDKFSIFKNNDLLNQYNIDKNSIYCLVKDFLTDEQKVQFLKLEHFKEIDSYLKSFIIQDITDDEIKFKLLEDYEFISELKLSDFQIAYIVASIKDEKVKEDLINFYEFTQEDIATILISFSDSSKMNILLEDIYELSKFKIETVLASLSVNSLIEFFNNNKDFLIQNKISPYHITKKLTKEEQIDFISKLENVNLSINDKRRILATLDKNAKKDIDTSRFPKEYITAIKQEVNDSLCNCDDINALYKIIVNLNGDLETYVGLDELLYINGMHISNEDKCKLFELSKICPSISIYDDIGLGESTIGEYRSAEDWIESILQGIDSNWTDIQKLAYIDNAIGKKISYSPDFDTEVFKRYEARPLWKVIDSDYGVCNGIAQIEKYMLDKVGIETERVSSEVHSFLKVKNIEIITVNGETIKGDTILDPTWNLSAHRCGAKPESFCRSYDEIRKQDIKKDGSDEECHKNDEELSSATLDLDEETLRMVFTSIGVADKDGKFPITEFMKKSKTIDNHNLPAEESIKEQLKLVEKYYPEFAECQNSITYILQGVSLKQKNLNFNKCVVNRVYERTDENKRPVLYVYADLPDAGKKFYFADKGTQQFVELPQKEFEKRFECYEMDMEIYDGYRPWENIETVEYIEDLSKSSGKMVASEGDER